MTYKYTDATIENIGPHAGYVVAIYDDEGRKRFMTYDEEMGVWTGWPSHGRQQYISKVDGGGTHLAVCAGCGAVVYEQYIAQHDYFHAKTWKP